ncbi:MAG: gliding motility-associated C-terminal domain-containing protein [Bacteroidetes bacterium]|nr:gliding motility-associated C-terminal domain-containing protein [Bacteroidota bacterium]
MEKFKTLLFIAFVALTIFACSKTEDPINNDNNIIIPNFFSPDREGYLHEWKVQDTLNLIDNSAFSAKVYDTGHRIVFIKFDKNIAWLGKRNDTANCDTGYYYYIVQYKSWTGISKFRTGTVFLSRKNP